MRSALGATVLTVLVALAGACGRGQEGGESERPRPPATLDGTIEAEMHALLADAVDAAARAAPDVVLEDDTPRLEGPALRTDGTRYVLLRGASSHVPIEGLDGLDLSIDDRGLSLRLVYGPVEVVVLDTKGAPGAARDHERYRGMAADFWEDGWPALEARVYEAGAALGEPKEAIAKRLQDHRQLFERWNGGFARLGATARSLRRAALRADPNAPGTELADLYETCRLLRLKAALVRDASGDATLAARAIAAGPAVGFQKGAVGRDAVVVVRLDGVDEMGIEIQARGGSPEDVAAFEERFLTLVRSFRPYAGGGARKHEATAPLIAALDALTAFHARRDADRAARLLIALRKAGALDEVQDASDLAERLADWIQAGADERAALLAAAQTSR